MKLDSEQQRKQLWEVVNGFPMSGNLAQVTQITNVLITLSRAIEQAGLEPKEEETK